MKLISIYFLAFFPIPNDSDCTATTFAYLTRSNIFSAEIRISKCLLLVHESHGATKIIGIVNVLAVYGKRVGQITVNSSNAKNALSTIPSSPVMKVYVHFLLI